MCTHTHMYMKGSRQRQQHNQRACSLCVGVPGAHGLQSPSENWHHVRYTVLATNISYVYDDVTYVYDDVTCVCDDVAYVYMCT